MTANEPALLRQCKGARQTVSRRVSVFYTVWKFQHIRLPLNSFTLVCAGLFTVKHYDDYWHQNLSSLL
jgi:hypothetical protein